ncbi:hypothetical protein V7S43_003196 [Phytophthora oleae]|uniref:Uncharacterized protein n=1 Tax=Phytophthora oleae TaxID=2107226 RepID=A0ABD3FYH1_9STRA
MNIDEFVCNPVEENTEMEILSNAENLDESTDMMFLETAPGEPIDCDDAACDDREGSEREFDEISTQSKVDAVRSVIYILSDHPDIEAAVLKDIRKLQGRVRDQLRLEKEETMRQTSITSFFASSTK